MEETAPAGQGYLARASAYVTSRRLRAGVQLAISRSREYEADATAARFIGHGYGLASALEKLGAYSKRVPMRHVEPSQAHMFIVQPLSGSWVASAFSTHPPVEERIRRLRLP